MWKRRTKVWACNLSWHRVQADDTICRRPISHMSGKHLDSDRDVKLEGLDVLDLVSERP
jgi:hypothetical protein